MTYIPTPIEKLHFRIIHFTNGFNLKVVETKEHVSCVILSFLYPFRLNGNQSLQFKYNILNCLIKLIKKHIDIHVTESGYNIRMHYMYLFLNIFKKLFKTCSEISMHSLVIIFLNHLRSLTLYCLE